MTGLDRSDLKEAGMLEYEGKDQQHIKKGDTAMGRYLRTVFLVQMNPLEHVLSHVWILQDPNKWVFSDTRQKVSDYVINGCSLPQHRKQKESLE